MSGLETSHESDVLVCDDVGMHALPRGHRFRVWRKPTGALESSTRHLFVLCNATDLPSVAEVVSSANRAHRLKALFVRTNIDEQWLPQMLERAGLRTLRNLLVHSSSELPLRVMRAWENNAASELVADAMVAGDTLFVMSCDLVRYEVAFDSMRALKRISKHDRSTFSISSDGSFIHWPEADIHLDIDAIRSETDESWKARTLAKRLGRNKRYGEAIAALRKEMDLRQSDVRSLSERQLRRIEGGEGVTGPALEALANAHGLSLEAYLGEVATRARALATSA
jgi:hypothetical protein